MPRGSVSRWLVVLPTTLAIACGGRSCGATPSVTGGDSSKQVSVSADGTPKGSRASFDAAFDALNATDRDMPAHSFSPAAIVGEVGKDPAQLLEWVRSNTSWVPYSGALRGAVGVLLDRTGNSLDRSLLLAELLRTAGHKTRLARARIGAEPVGRLMQEFQSRSAGENLPPGSRPSGGKNLAELAQEFRLDADRLAQILAGALERSNKTLQELRRRTANQTKILEAAVDLAQRSNAPRHGETGDHWWVQRLEGSQWVDYDPNRPNSSPSGFPATPEGTFAYDLQGLALPLPSEFVHEVEVRVVVEQWRSGSLTTKTALRHVLRPAELIGLPIRLEHVPLKWQSDRALSSGDPLAAFVNAVKDQDEWLPVLVVGDRRIIQSLFTTAGDIVPFKDRGASTGLKPSSVMGGFDALGGEPDDSGAGEPKLTAEWIEYEIRTPGASLQTVRRDVFDLVPELRGSQTVPDPNFDAERRKGRGLALLGSTQLLPMVSRLTPEYVQKLIAGHLGANRQTLARIRYGLETMGLEDLVSQFAQLKPVPDQLLNLALGRFLWSPVDTDVYLDRINLLSYRTGVFVSQDSRLMTRQGFDILSNDVAVRPGGPSAPSIRLAQGIADTNLEGLMVGDDAINAGTLLDAASARGESWSTIRTKAELDRTGDSLSHAQRGWITQDLSQGYVVILSSGKDPDRTTSWWRVDPRTGSALGMGPQGWGQGGVERVIKESLVAVLSAFAVGGFATYAICMFANGAGELSLKNPNSNKCLCAGLAGGAIAGALVTSLVFVPSAALTTWAAAGISSAAAGVATLKNWQVGTGIVMALAAMAKEALC